MALGRDIRVWANIIVPLWAPANSAPMIRKIAVFFASCGPWMQGRTS
jgi:hypothetical protein